MLRVLNNAWNAKQCWSILSKQSNANAKQCYTETERTAKWRMAKKQQKNAKVGF